MKKYAVIYRAYDEEGFSSVSTMQIEAVSIEDAESRFYAIWQEDNVVIKDIMLCKLEEQDV